MLPQNYTNATGETGKTINTLSVLRLAFISGCLIFLGVVVYLIEVEKQQPVGISATVLLLITAGLLVLCVFLRQFISEKKYAAIDPAASTASKLSQFRTIIIFQLAMIELPLLFIIVSYYLTSNRIFLMLAGFMVINFFTIKINRQVIDEKLGVTN